jgi:hypothetical protein
VSAGSLLGLAALNALLLLAGCGIVWGLRGWGFWTDLLRLAGLAYLLGVAAVTLLVAQLLIVGVSLTPALVIACCLLVAAAGAAAGVALRRPRPALRRTVVRPEPFLAVGVGFAVLAVVVLQSYFRVARGNPLTAWDAWAFWTTKAKAIHYFGGLDREIFATIHAPTYPLFVPTLEGMAFAFMGAADTITLHVQFWLLAAGFVFAVAAVLRPHVPLALLWPFLALLLVMPEFLRRAIQPTADWTLNYFFALAALCLALWVTRRREAWPLLASGILLAGALSTKRAGVLLAGCVLVGAAAATWRERGHAWPRLGVVGAAAFATTVPWRLWVSEHAVAVEPVRAAAGGAGAPGPAAAASGGQGTWALVAFLAAVALALGWWLWRRRAGGRSHRVSPRAATALVVVGGLAAAAALTAWHVAAGDVPGGGLDAYWDRRGRIVPAFTFLVSLLVDYGDWLLAVPLGLATAVLVLVLRRRGGPAVVYLCTFVLAVAGFVWAQWAVPEMPLERSGMTPMPRAVGALVLLSVAFAPLMLAQLLERRPAPGAEADGDAARAPAA